MKKSQIFTRTFLCTISIMAALLLLLHLTIYILFPLFYLSNAKSSFARQADLIATTLSDLDVSDIKNYLKIHAKTSSTRILLQTDPKSTDSLKITDDFSPDKSSTNTTVFIEERTIKLQNHQTATLQLIFSRNAEIDAKNLTLKFLPYSLIIGFAFSLLFSYFSSKIIVKPLLAAEKIANDLEKAKTAFLRSASHELKTPLSGLRITLENMKYNVGDYKNHAKYLDSSIELVDKMSNLIVEILSLSSYQEWLKSPTKIDLGTALPDILAEYQPLISARRLTVNLNLTDATMLISEPACQKLFSNLISNALHYSDPGGTINIYTKNHWLHIENPCPPIPKHRIPTLFNLFHHGEHQNSTGIGLFIVKNILTHYRLKFHFRPTKSGMIFSIKLP